MTHLIRTPLQTHPGRDRTLGITFTTLIGGCYGNLGSWDTGASRGGDFPDSVLPSQNSIRLHSWLHDLQYKGTRKNGRRLDGSLPSLVPALYAQWTPRTPLSSSHLAFLISITRHFQIRCSLRWCSSRYSVSRTVRFTSSSSDLPAFA